MVRRRLRMGVDQVLGRLDERGVRPAARPGGLARRLAGLVGRLVRWLGELIRYTLAAFACFALDIGALIALRTATPLPLALDTALAFGLAAVLGFVLNRQWVFPRTAQAGRPQADFARYLALVTAALLVTTVVVSALAGIGLDYRIAKLVASGVVALANFVIMPRWVFRPGAAPAPDLRPREEAPDPVPR